MSRRIPAAAALLALLTALCIATVLAADSAVTLPVRVEVSGDAPSPAETFTLTLRAAAAGAPRPEGSRGGLYTCTVAGGGSTVLSLPAAQVGRHLYTLHQEAGGYVRGEYDSRVYHIAVTVTADGVCTAAVYGDGAMAGDKYDAAVFRNVYRSRTKPEEPLRPSPKTADGGMAVYAALALASMAGIAAAVGQKDAF